MNDELNDLLDDVEMSVEETDIIEELETEGEEVTEEEPKVKKKAPPAPAKIARGRMPAPVVYAIRFLEENQSISELAKKYFTTAGKITDVVKNAGFKYVTKKTQFSQADIDKAVECIKKNFVSGTGHHGGVSETTIEDADYTLKMLAQVPVSDESSLVSDRTALRKSRGDKKVVEEPKAEEVKEEPKAEEVKEERSEEILDDLEELLEAEEG